MKALKVFVHLLLMMLLATTACAANNTPPLLVYAAASLTNVLDEVGAAYSKDTGQEVKFSYAASSTLARQIEAGANADIFFSADSEWLDYLQSRKLIDASTRSNLLGNRLVLIAARENQTDVHIAPGFSLAAILGSGRLAIGDPDSVPAGKYARAALTALGVWNAVADKLVRADSVRGALAFVDRGEAPLGIVYETDALIDNNVRIVDTFPDSSHPPIVYPIALTNNAKVGANKFLAFLRSSSAQAAFKKYGFGALQ
jgi:molybdate transport system substrate-binding protein